MDQPGSPWHSFIIRLSLHTNGRRYGKAVWRGYIKHIPGDEEQAVKKLGDIEDFILVYLEALGMRATTCQRMRRRYRQFKRLWKRG